MVRCTSTASGPQLVERRDAPERRLARWPSDLATENDYVRDRIATWIVENFGAGASGIRLDATKHICPDDIAAIFGKAKTYMGGALPNDFMTYLEVIIGGEGDVFWCNYNTYQYSQYFTDALKKSCLSDSDIAKVNIRQSWYSGETAKCDGRVPNERLAIENDDHDQQNRAARRVTCTGWGVS